MTKQNLFTLQRMLSDKIESIRNSRHEDIEALENVLDFISDVYELAYGDSAIDKDYSSEEVLQRLQDFSDDAHTYEENYKFQDNM